LRPHLHPDMGQIVLCARVSRHLTYHQTRNCPPDCYTWAQAARAAARALPLDYSGFMRFALHSLAIYLDIGFTSSQWLTSVLEAAHLGSSFRRCFFFDYKEQRRAYPRVTNRGVQISTKSRKSQLRRAKLNGSSSRGQSANRELRS
jgi:hypothetical protein